MVETDLLFIKNNIKRDQKLLALDVSKKRLGLALSDSTLSLATPFSTIHRYNLQQDLKEIFLVCKKHNIFALVIGYPLDLHGNQNSRTQSINAFVKEILKIEEIPIFLQDERFSTAFVKEFIKEQVISTKQLKKNKDMDDKAASLFLQTFLDRIKYSI